MDYKNKDYNGIDGEIMKKEILKSKLDDLVYEIKKAKDVVDDYSKDYLNSLEKLIENYERKIELNELQPSNGGNLGFRRAILEYDDLSDIDSLYDAACEVDSFYSEECQKWN